MGYGAGRKEREGHGVKHLKEVVSMKPHTMHNKNVPTETFERTEKEKHIF